MLNSKEKVMGLKFNVECCKDECVNECVGLATWEDKSPVLFDECRNERTLCVIPLDREMYLDDR